MTPQDLEEQLRQLGANWPIPSVADAVLARIESQLIPPPAAGLAAAATGTPPRCNGCDTCPGRRRDMAARSGSPDDAPGPDAAVVGEGAYGPHRLFHAR